MTGADAVAVLCNQIIYFKTLVAKKDLHYLNNVIYCIGIHFSLNYINTFPYYHNTPKYTEYITLHGKLLHIALVHYTAQYFTAQHFTTIHCMVLHCT